jgi:hypothetical protein
MNQVKLSFLPFLLFLPLNNHYILRRGDFRFSKLDKPPKYPKKLSS